MNKSLFASVILLMTTLTPAHAGCDLYIFEQAPKVPTAEQSTLDQLLRARLSVQQFIENAEKTLEDCDFEPLRHNYYVSSIRKLAEQFNQQVQVFRSL